MTIRAATDDKDDLLWRKIRRTFPRENPADILAILELYGDAASEPDAERVRLAILKLSAGDLDRLRESIEAAKQDYRDVLAWAEYPNQMRERPGETAEMSAEARASVRQKDAAQYLAWLNDIDEPEL